MQKRRLLFLDLAVLALVGGWGVWFFTVAVIEPIQPAAYERIRLGMTQPEVEAIIGLPPGYYSKVPGLEVTVRESDRWSAQTPFPARGPIRAATWRLRGRATGMADRIIQTSWWGDTYAIQVHFDRTGRADARYLLDVTPEESTPTVFQRLRQSLGF